MRRKSKKLISKILSDISKYHNDVAITLMVGEIPGILDKFRIYDTSTTGVGYRIDDGVAGSPKGYVRCRFSGRFGADNIVNEVWTYLSARGRKVRVREDIKEYLFL